MLFFVTLTLLGALIAATPPTNNAHEQGHENSFVHDKAVNVVTPRFFKRMGGDALDDLAIFDDGNWDSMEPPPLIKPCSRC